VLAEWQAQRALRSAELLTLRFPDEVARHERKAVPAVYCSGRLTCGVCPFLGIGRTFPARTVSRLAYQPSKGLPAKAFTRAPPDTQSDS
jgi:hypothetical protein